MCKACVKAGITASRVKSVAPMHYKKYKNHYKLNDRKFSSSDTLNCECCNRVITFSSGQYIMVKNSIWNKVKRNSTMLCKSCIEKRLKRELELEDLTGAFCNGVARNQIRNKPK